MTRARVQVRGRVQGVFFRAEARARAESLGVAGWIRNLPDGRVEAVFEGEDEHVESMVEWCRRGPAGAKVEEVDVERQEPVGETGFRVR
ncbi:MAG TPA: acylphosphatase [Gaiellaceae bacterium]|nr:acylphosphatase [Gaiellaceae bacterium]